MQLSFNVLMVLNLACNKNGLYKTLYYWSRDVLSFDVLEKGMGIVSLPHFVCDFSRLKFLKSHSIYWPDFIDWMYLLLEMWLKMCIAFVCWPGCNDKNFEINLNLPSWLDWKWIFLIKPLFIMTKKSGQQFKYVKNKISF